MLSRTRALHNMAKAVDVVTYPRPTGPSKVVPKVLPQRRPLNPLYEPPQMTAPARPARPELPPPPAGWTRTNHAAPAAFPKEVREAHGTLRRSSQPFQTAAAAADESKEARNARLKNDKDNCIEQRYGAQPWTVEDARAAGARGHWQAVERWRRDKPTGSGKVLVCSHANGLQKEHWQVVFRDLLSRDPRTPSAEFGTGAPLGAPTYIEIDDIWMLDDCNHGESVDLNAGLLGPVQTWRDDTRDVLNFISHVLPGVYASEGRVGWQLSWTPEGRGGALPPIIGVGHSFGGNAMVQACAARPELFEALFLVDPIVPPHFVPYDAWKAGTELNQLTGGALRRRSQWASRAEAAKAMRAQPFFAAWDPDTFDLYVSHGLVPVDESKPDGPVTLATPPWCEAAVFTEPEGFALGWMALPHIPVPVGFAMAADPVATHGEEITGDFVWRPPRARNERLTDAGHLITQEKPHKLADTLWRFLATLQAGVWDAPKAKL